MEEQRVDKYLTTKYPNLSRAYIKNQIKLGNFLIGDKQVKPSYEMREGDQVALAPGFILPDATQILSNPNIKLDVIYENTDVIVINKPAGLSVHPRQDKNGLPLAQEIDNTLASGLLAYYPAIANIGDFPALRPGIVHRLDKDTSGVMIIAKNQNSFGWLKEQFKERKATKTYLALVHDLLKNKEGEIKTLLHRAVSDPTKQKISKTEGKEAITQYRVIKEFKNYSLLEVSPKTGRLHQIRVHLAHLGHTVVGDKKYGQPLKSDFKGDPKSDFNELLIRQFLHAQELKITLPNGQKRTFKTPLPTDLQDILNALAEK